MRHRRPAAPAGHGTAPPEERSLTDPRFIGSFPGADVVLDPPLPELTLLGRSNVGKSSLLNALAGRKIARVSGTPGKTRMLNVYELPTAKAWGSGGVGALESNVPTSPRPHAFYLLDLPGYGYAKAPKTERATFRPLIEATLRRPRVAGILWLLDIRRELGSHDAEVRELLAAGGVRTLAVLTKGDKLPQAARRRQAELWRETLEFEPAQMVVTSAQAGTGIEDLRHAIDTLLNEAAP